VDLLVAQGEQPAAYVMPWLVGLSQPDADHILSAGGLKLAKTNSVSSPQWPKGAITDQTPEAGTKINSDSVIVLTVAE
jgi:beta-lactam-binding protein with PASTA domain